MYYYINSTKEIYNYQNIDSISEVDKKEDDDEIEENTIIIHITGAVENEGIVEVKENARINDVIKAAGGLSDDANLESVNLAYAVEDGQKIYIPSIKDQVEDIEDDELASQNASNEVIQQNDDQKSTNLININTASQEKLEELPGIGSSIATKIITYREKNGKFKNIEDIKNVSGIGDAKYDTIKNYICI